MASTFSGITTALSSLYAQRRALDVAGQNIANANTEGYTRQRVQMTSASGNTMPTRWSTSDGIGNGVAISDIRRTRDEFLEGRGREERANSAYLTNQKQQFVTIENTFAEPSDTALQHQMGELWGAFSDVSNSPNDRAIRTALIQQGNTVVDGIHSAYNALGAQWKANRDQADAYATEVNTLAKNIAQLNTTIQRATAAGLPVNEMADQRDVQLMKISELTGATSSLQADGTAAVYLGGSGLVQGVTAREIRITGADRLQNQTGDPASSVTVRWADSGTPAQVGGTLASIHDTLTNTIPKYANSLDGVAANLAATVNTIHAGGYGLDGTGGRTFFTGSTAESIKVAFDDPEFVAASGTSGTFDAANADALADLATTPGGPAETYAVMIANLGVEAQSVDRRQAIQSVVTQDTDAARESFAGVNLDEEMTQLITYQRGYEAASRVLNAVDEMLDVLINRMAV
ncbi:flagellar hook-associated protein 1 FlgK [Catenuloplanes nepalensis]|uniref:Flagellar hook-associated protein 1 n=1 Tax=Catenuloplanes nepalensis TaxID=587533 RepID=A0ABT9N3F2_9ACTN|nr:flagellar hook-associated protein FlgK [Catenuloplanes nepalensis]MDP9798033.1 flagellar hook-associated protein 1 FlgK [Catenuloplanes nepalensis]